MAPAGSSRRRAWRSIDTVQAIAHCLQIGSPVGIKGIHMYGKLNREQERAYMTSTAPRRLGYNTAQEAFQIQMQAASRLRSFQRRIPYASKYPIGTRLRGWTPGRQPLREAVNRSHTRQLLWHTVYDLRVCLYFDLNTHLQRGQNLTGIHRAA